MLFFKYTSSDDLVRIVFEKIRFFPKISYLSKKTISILTRPIIRCLPGSKIVYNICYQGSLHNARMCSSGKFSLNGVVSIGALGIRDKWSAITFFTPFLSHILRSNAYKRRIHRMSLALTSSFVRRYLSAEWSMNIVVLNPSRYGRNFSNMNTTTKDSFSV